MVICKEFLEMLDSYINLEVEDVCKRIEMRVHIDLCEDCRKIYTERRHDKDIKERGF